jgi:hypothetical protein
MKNMLAMLCSNPAATNAEIGKTIAATLSITERSAAASQTARQTSVPRMASGQNHEEGQRGLDRRRRERRHTDPEVVAPPPLADVDHPNHREGADRIPQIHDAPVREQSPDAVTVLITTRLFPMNSSAPATTTGIRPSEKPTPASQRVGPKPNSDPVPIVIAKTGRAR